MRTSFDDLRPRLWWLLMLPLVLASTTRELWAPDEPRYAQVGREIYETGRFLVMHLCGDLYPDKPPLLFWLSGFFGWLSGWSELAMRIPSLAATAVTAWLVARLARRWWGAAAAAWAPALYLTTAMVTEIGGRLQIDPLLTALCLGALDLLLAGAEARRPVARVLAAGMLIGIGGLAKGPVGLVNVALPAALIALAGPRRMLPRAPVAAWLGAVVLSIAVPATWAAAAALQEPALWSELFFGQHAGRVTQADRHPGPPWKPLTRMPLLLLPWTGAVIAGLGPAWRALRRRRSDGDDDGRTAAGLWLLGLFVFYSVIPPKRDLYLLPAYPAAALLAARTLTTAFDRGRLSRWVTWSATLPLLVVGIALAGSHLFTDEIAGLLWRGPAVGLPLLLGAAWSLMELSRGRLTRWALSLVVGWAVFSTAISLVVFPPLNAAKSARQVAEELAARPEKPRQIPCYGVQPEGYRFYGHGEVPTVRPRELDTVLSQERGDFLALMHVNAWSALEPDLRRRLRVIAERQVGGKPMLVIGAAADSGEGG